MKLPSSEVIKRKSFREIALRHKLKCYSLFAGSVAVLALGSIFIGYVFGLTVPLNRAIDVQLTIAGVLLITLSIIFSIIVLGVQVSMRNLPAEVSEKFFRIPIFRLTLTVVVISTVANLIIPGLISIFPKFFLEIIVTGAISSGILSLPLMLYSVLIFPQLLSTQGLLEHTLATESDNIARDILNQVIRSSIRERDIQTARSSLGALLTFNSQKIEASKSTATGIAPPLGTIYEEDIPSMINLTLDFDTETLHAQFHEILITAIEESVRSNCTEVLYSIKRSLISITLQFRQHPDEVSLWMDYLCVYEGALRQLRRPGHIKQDSLPAISLLSYFLLDLFKSPRPEWDEGALIHMTDTVMDSFDSLFRILTFQFDLQPLPKPEIEEGITIERSPSPPSETDELAAISKYFTSTVRKIQNEWCDLATSEDGSLFIAPPLSSISSVVFINWGRDSGLWLLGLYIECAYMFCRENNESEGTWETQFLSTLQEIRIRDNPDNLYKSIHQCYANREYEMQFFEESDRTGDSPREFEEWLSNFLHSAFLKTS